MIAFLGGTIGNLLPQERIRLLAVLADQMSAGDFLLLGADLVKDPDRLVAAYADSAGITAAFNRNMLHVLRRELGAEVDPEAFDHLAVWDPDQEWIEMRLRSARDQVVRVLDLGVPFPTGAELRTEISAKFRPKRIAQELRAAGLHATRRWADSAGDYAVILAAPTATDGVAGHRPR